MAEPPTLLQEPALPSSNTSLLAGSGHNLDDIYRRLRSFSPTTWFGKPPQLSALECAGKGWSNSGPDQLSCLSCGCQILCKLPINPWSEQAAGVVLQFSKRLVDAHSPHCPQRRQLLLDLPQQQQQTAPRSLSFPLLPTKKLSGAFYSRVQELQQLEAMPHVPASTRAHLAAAAASLDPSILTGLAAILQMPPTALQREAAAALARQDAAAGSSLLSRDQAQALIALCGWQLKLLLPPDMAPPAAADKSASIFGVSHLLPRRGESSTGPAPTAVAAAGSTPISSSCTALECELCGSQVGLWKYSCSGPFYAQQLASKAMQALAAAAAASTAALPEGDTAADGPPAAPNTAAAAAGGATQAPDGSKPESTSTPACTAQQKQGATERASAEATAAAAAAAVASPEVVFSTLCHTIAGGSLLTAGASGGGSSGGMALNQPGARLASAGPSSGGPLGQQQQQQQQPALQPFGSMPQPAFGSPAAAGSVSAGKPPPHQQPSPATAGGSKLFGELQGVPSASVFGSPPPVASAAAAVGPFGAVAGGSGASGGDQAAAAPVFGLQAFAAEEQRTKRRRSSAAAAEFAAAAAAAVAVHAAEGVGGSQGPGTPAAPGPSTGGGPSSSTASPAAAGTGAAAAAVLASGGGRVRRFSQQRSGLAAAVAAATGGLAAAEESCFDPVAAHRSWCPWVKAYSTAQQPGVELGSSAAAAAAAGSSGGLAAAVRLGWSSTVMAVQEALLEEELSKPLEQQRQQAAGVDSMEGDDSSTAAVMARARQAIDLLQSQD